MNLGELDRHLFVCRPARGAERSLVVWAGTLPNWVDPDRPAELVVIGLWHFSMPIQDTAAFVAGRLEKLYHAEERRRGIRIGVLWDATAWGDVRHAGHFVAALPFGLHPGLVIRVEGGDRLPSWEAGRSLAVGRDVLLSHLGRGMRDTVRVSLPAEGKVLESGVVLVGRDELKEALARVQAKPPRPLGLEAAPEERELLLEDHMAAAVGLALWAGEQGLGDHPHPRDTLEQFVQERGDPYRPQPRQRVH